MAIERKLNADLSYYYKKNLKAVHAYFKRFLTKNELKADIRELTTQRIQQFLDGYTPSGANYMNRRR